MLLQEEDDDEDDMDGSDDDGSDNDGNYPVSELFYFIIKTFALAKNIFAM